MLTVTRAMGAVVVILDLTAFEDRLTAKYASSRPGTLPCSLRFSPVAARVG